RYRRRPLSRKQCQRQTFTSTLGSLDHPGKRRPRACRHTFSKRRFARADPRDARGAQPHKSSRRGLGKRAGLNSDLGPARRRLLAGMNRAALSAFAGSSVGVKGLIKRRQIADQMLHLHFDAVDERAAFETVPLKTIKLLVATLGLDNKANRAGRSLRRVA